MLTFSILIIFLLSGFAGLSYEIVWIKKLSLIFGVSSHAISSVVAAYMGGLALGSYLFGRFADRRRVSLRLYALLELGIAVSAILLQLIFPLIDSLFIQLSKNFGGYTMIFIIFRFLLCFAALMIPTTLMGATLPVVSKFFIAKIQKVGEKIGWLYSVNTIGGVLGCLTTGFILLRFIGADQTVYAAAGLNIIAAVLAMTWDVYFRKSLQKNPPQSIDALSPAAQPVFSSDKAIDEDKLRSFKRLLIALYGIAGFTSIAYEVLWSRVLVYLLGNDIYSFTTILSTFLIGIALGSYFFARFADKSQKLVAAFGLLQLGIGFSSALFLSALGRGFLNGSNLQVYLNFCKSFVLIITPTFLMGAAFPIIIKLLTSNVKKLGENVGNIYAVNTIGGIIGSLTAGFILLPLLGAQKGIIFLSGVSILLGATALAAAPVPTLSRRRTSILTLAAMVAVIIAAININPTAVYSKAFYGDSLREILYYHESAEASLTVLRGKYNSRGLNINGETTAYTEFRDLLVHKMLAHIPALLAKEAENALVIGFGLGSTAHSLSQYPLKRIDCAELVPKEKETARFFIPENNHILDHPNFNFINADGRNYLKTSRVKYDIISMNAIHPKNSPYLYTREFYRLCKQRLTAKGIMCAWMPTNTPYFSSLIKTFQTVFPHASLWFCNTGHMVLIGTPEKLQIDFQHWQTMLQKEKIKSDLADLLLHDPIQLLSTMIIAEEALYEYTKGSLVQTDNLPKIEFEHFTDESNEVIISNFDRLLTHRSHGIDYLTNISDEKRLDDLKYRLDQFYQSMKHAPDGMYFIFSLSQPEQIIERMDKALAACPENLPLLYDYNFIWASWILGSPEMILSQRGYIEKVEALRQQLMSHYRPILAQSSRPVIDLAVTSVRLAHAMVACIDKNYETAQTLSEKVLKVDPYLTLAEEIYQDAVALRKATSDH